MKHTGPSYAELDSWQTYLDKMTPAYRRFIAAEEEYVLRFAKKHLNRGSRVVDIGSGTGRTPRLLAPLVREAVGVEREYRQIEEAERKTKEKNVRYVYSDGRRLPFSDGEFDLAMCLFSTIGNQGYDKFGTTQEMRRAVKDRGHVLVSAYAENAAPFQLEFYKNIGWDMESIQQTGKAIYYDKGSVVSERFPRKKLRRLFIDNGFPRVKIRRLADFVYMAEARKT